MIRFITLTVVAAVLSACSSANNAANGIAADARAAADAPIEVDRDADEYWRDIAPEDLLIIELEWGNVVVELAPWFAPRHVEQMRRLARSGYYNADASFYRVIDNFVAQGGVMRNSDDSDDSSDRDAAKDAEEVTRAPTLAAEFERPLGDLPFVRNNSPDLYAPQTGHIRGFAAGYDPATGNTWLLHCYGVMAMARSADPNTGSSHFYIVNGRDQRYLDRNLTVFGRVVAGMDVLQKVTRGDRAIGNGVIPNPADRTPILGMTVASELPDSQRPHLQVMKSDSPAFAAAKADKFYSDSDFFSIKPKAVEACQVTGPVRTRP